MKFGRVRRRVKAQIGFAILVLLLFAQTTGQAQLPSAPPPPYSKGFLVTGDYVVGGVDLTEQANPIDPKFGPLANKGGPTKTHALLAGSLAIDKGDNAALPPTDQRGIGFPRKKDGDGNGTKFVDIGAFEK